MPNAVLSAFLFGISLLICAVPAIAQSVLIGQPCPGGTSAISTQASTNQQVGILGCIPDGNGNYRWQPENGGMARYDSTASCTVAGTMRWNGSAMQYCDGASWQSLGGAVPSGTLCGMAWWDTQFHNVGIRVMCQGHQVLTGGGAGDCPADFPVALVGMEHDDSHEWHAFYSCVKS
jgi:hypothetical protein